jgi:putative transposase
VGTPARAERNWGLESVWAEINIGIDLLNSPELTCRLGFDIISAVLRAVKFRLYPNSEQSQRLTDYIDSSRGIFNRALEQRIYAIKENGKGIDYPAQQKQLTLQRRAGMNEIPVDIQRDGLRRIDVAFKNFFRRCKEGAKKKGFPRFKSANRYNSFTAGNAADFAKDGRVKIPGIDRPIRCRGMQTITGKQKQLTIIRRAGKWFGRILVDDGQQPPVKKPIKSPIGIDMGLNSFLTTSAGDKIDCPRHYRRLSYRLRRAQRLFCRRKKGSKRRGRALLSLQRVHAKIADCRDDFTHKLSKEFVGKYDLIAAEKLNIRGMIRSNLAKSILDAGWGKFLFRIGYKAENAGATFIQGNPKNTSIDCSDCGTPVPKTLKDRVHCCHNCGLTMDRDQNAARNVLKRATSSLSTPG